LTDELAAAIEAGAGELLYGFADHRLETTWLASSTGLRRRWVQPTGTVEVNGKIADDLTRSAWAGAYTADFTDLDYPLNVADEYTAAPGLDDPQAFAARVVGDSMLPNPLSNTPGL